jgi:hypothetical protein
MWDYISVTTFPYALWALLPLIPAILIFLIFPDTEVATSGPLAGLTVKASGAFGAYLIIFAAIGIAIIEKWNINDFRQQFWIVDGYVELIDANEKPIWSSDYLKKLIVKAKPEPYRISEDSIILRIVEGETGKLPKITIIIPEFGEETVDLNASDLVKRDNVHRTIELKPIRIKSKEAFPLPR